MRGDGQAEGAQDGSEVEDTAGQAEGKDGQNGGGQNKPTDHDADLIQGVSLNDLDPKARSIVEARLKAIQANNTRKRMAEAKTVKMAEENLHLLDRYSDLAKNPRVAAAMEAVLKGEPMNDGQAGGEGEAGGDEEIQLSDDPMENLKRFKAQAVKEANASADKRLDARVKELEGRFGRSLGSLHDQSRQTEWEKVASEFPDTDYPEVHVAKDEIMAFAREKGLPIRKALWAHMGEELGSKLRESTEQVRKIRGERSDRIADDPYPRLQRLLAAGDRKPFRSTAESQAYFEEHGYPTPKNGVKKAGAGARE